MREDDGSGTGRETVGLVGVDDHTADIHELDERVDDHTYRSNMSAEFNSSNYIKDQQV